ncbi:MAG: hypothetical protein KQH79_12895 [Bacteroidetes bacterium]|nr:hypothetical protein [Bacteroidota bacterium]
MKKIYLALLCIVYVNVLFAQDYDSKYNTRTVLISAPDSIIKAKIRNTKTDFKIYDELKYYWFANDKIGYNRGGVNGNALHGTYTVYDAENRLMTQGEFRNGLKFGKWKTWYKNGELKSVENYKEGLKQDIQRYYNTNGEIEKEVEYKKGVKVDKNNDSFLKKLFKNKEQEKAVDDSTKTNKEVVKKNDNP